MSRSAKWRTRHSVVAVILMGLVLAACGGEGTTTTTTGDGATTTSSGGNQPTTTGGQGEVDTTFTYAAPQDPRSLWGNSNTAQAELNVAVQITEKLIEFNPDVSGFEGRLATSWETVDANTLRIELREGITFTNGEAFNAESAKFSLDQLIAASAYAAFTQALDENSVTIVDENTIEVKSNGSADSTLFSLAMGSFQYPKEYFEEVGAEEFGLNPIGTGPFVFVEWERGVKVVLEANEDYWNGAPFFKEVEFLIIPDPAARVAALQSGQVDFVPELTHGFIPQVESNDSLDLYTLPGNRLLWVAFNAVEDGSGDPWKDPAVRRALRHAIDQEAIINGPLAGHAFPLNMQALTPSHFGFDAEAPFTDYDPELAKSLLAEAGYPDGFEIVLDFTPNDAEVAAALAAQFAAVGVTVQQNSMEQGAYFTHLVEERSDGMFIWGGLYPPDAGFVWGSSSLHTGGRYEHFANPEFDDLWNQQLVASTSDERLAIFDQILDIFMDQVPFIPVFHGEDAYGVSTRIQGFTPRISQYVDIAELSGS